MHRSHSELNLATGTKLSDLVTQEVYVNQDDDDDASEYRGIDIFPDSLL